MWQMRCRLSCFFNAANADFSLTQTHTFATDPKYVYGTKVMDIKPDSIAKIKIPLPTLEEQDRIVSILDKLYKLTNDISLGLPAEIEARKQQYEYYRDKLLTFKKKA